MKLKDNQIAVYNLINGGDFTLPYPPSIYFIGKEAKELSKNTKNLEWSDGNNWKEEEISFEKIIEFEDSENTTGEPAFSFSKTIKFADGSELELVTSNISGSLTPYWKEDSMY